MPYIEISKPNLRNNLKQLFAMRNSILILFLGVAFSALGQQYPPYSEIEPHLAPINFELHAVKGSHMQPCVNDSLVWELWVEPIGRVNDLPLFKDYYVMSHETVEQRFEKHGQEPAFELLDDSGSKLINYSTKERGIHHLILRNKISGDLYAYFTLLIESDATIKFEGRTFKKAAFDGLGSISATFAPFQENELDGLYEQGLQ